ncbi:transcription antitermination factor NusB [Gemella sp. GH3]|uniref:transcription antitermination factor NusB n=1 Tax=unclassified Gemella TaxID=2624949 RepID=UPI0015D0C3AF|nr:MULTISPECIES: transcription antitermination factor NusB [unclassified Gemella]MBF0713306.1 transcription antitermination factor NusB [Gemella sp. GH3.1]NYS50258.1 transcription antitermination factor NusB [Gemella sp. GH3]
MKTRHELREITFKLLFQIDNNDLDFDTVLELEDEDVRNNPYVVDTVNGIQNHKDEIDSIISENLKGWTISRLSKMDRQILRIAIYEIKYSDIPYKVSINEAVELSKKYSEKDESYKFINGVLKGVVEKVANN